MQVGRFKIRPREATMIGALTVAGDAVVGQIWPDYGGLLLNVVQLFIGG